MIKRRAWARALSELLNGVSGISPEMTIRLEQAFGSTAETWLKNPAEYDLWQRNSARAN
jgi:addiction module HigA family antidote